MDGQKLVQAYTLNTMYANNKIELVDEAGEVYRIDVNEILKLLKKVKHFKVDQKRKYNHLSLFECEICGSNDCPPDSICLDIPR